MKNRSLPLLFALAFTPAAGAADPAPALSGGPIFVPNRGQWPEAARFRAQAGPVTAWLTGGGWWLVAGVAEPGVETSPFPPGPVPPAPTRAVAIRMELDGAPTEVRPEGLDTLPGRCNFLVGNDPARWARNLPIHGRVRYHGAWPGIDVVLRAEGQALAYDVELATGARIEDVRFRCEGIDGLALEEGGALLLHTSLGAFRQRPPRAWQVLPGGGRRPVAASFRIADAESYGFAVAGLEPGLPLVIDPDLTWLTHLGGAGADHLLGIAREASGRVTVAGVSGSWNLPVTAGVFQAARNGLNDAYVARMDPSQSGASQLLWCTYLGGAGDDCAFAVAVSGPGFATVAGSTCSTNFPVAKAIQATLGGGWDGFVARLDPLGAVLLFSTYLGGWGTDHAFTVHVDAGQATTLGGSTDSTNFPMCNAFQGTCGGLRDVFACRLDPQGLTLTWSTYLGGSFDELWYTSNWTGWPMNIRDMGMDVDAQGRILLGGRTFSPNFPVRNAYQPGLNGTWGDAFATILDPGQTPGSQLVWSTFLGGTTAQGALAAAFGPGGVTCIGGYTYSSNFPTTTNAFCTTFIGTSAGPYNDAFVSWLDPTKTGPAQLAYSTFLGGTEYDGVAALSLDARGFATAGGYCSPNFPVTAGAFDITFNGPTGTQDAWLARLRPLSLRTGDLVYSTYLGGPNHDNLFALTATGTGGVFFSGATCGSGLPITPGAFQPIFSGTTTGFAGHLHLLPTNVTRRGGATLHCSGPALFEVDARPVAGSPINFLAGNAPPTGAGVLMLGLTSTAPWALGCGVELWTQPVFWFPLISNVFGTATFSLPTQAQWAGILFGAQPAWFPTATCTWGQPACSSAALDIQL